MKTDERIEDQLREMLHAAVGDEPPLTSRSPSSAHARSARQWLASARRPAFAPMAAKFAMSLALAGVVAVGAVVAPSIGDDPPQTGSLIDPAASGSPAPSPSASATATTPAGGTRAYRDERIGFALRYPSDWTKVGSSDLGRDFVAFVSPSDASNATYAMWQQHAPDCDARCPVAVPVQLVNFAEHDEYLGVVRRIVSKWRSQGVSVTELSARVAGRATTGYHVEFPDRAAADANDQEWCRGCRGDWYLVRWYHGTTLDVRVMALDAAAYRSHRAEARGVVSSIKDIGPPSENLSPPTPSIQPVPGPAPKPMPSPTLAPADCTPYGNGSITTSITCDRATEAVLRFAERRVGGAGAEMWLSVKAKKSYDANAGGLSLYTPEGERPYRSYFVTERQKMSDGTIRFTLEMNQGYVGDEPDRVRTEHVWIAKGSAWDGSPTPNGRVVVAAELIDGPTEGTSP